jgi:hypothetical protein
MESGAGAAQRLFTEYIRLDGDRATRAGRETAGQ